MIPQLPLHPYLVRMFFFPSFLLILDEKLSYYPTDIGYY